jgi:2-polyprenyl-3-methyl-5-hydroxy-6-metoxy-1,4-benzoquinol methylase
MNAIAAGHYYRKQLGCRSSVIAWSHRSRFEMGLRLIGAAPRRLLDYGCGDATFLAMASDRIQEGTGADVAPDQVQECNTRLAGIANLRFCTVKDLIGPTHEAAYDVVTCMETLEHCTTPVVEVVLRDLSRLVTPDGRVIISVPIEIGPTFLIKLGIRKVAAWRRLSDYRYYESYSLCNALRMIFANRTTDVERPVYDWPGGPTHSHYGFNWRSLRARVRDHLHIEQTVFSPLGFLGGGVSSQVWFVCRRR